MKRILSFILPIIMLFTPVHTLAADTRKSGLYTYEIKGNGTITITDFDWENNDGDIYIPNMIDGYTVTGIGDEAFACEVQISDDISVSITLSSNIKSIGNKAFFNANIVSISLPNALQYIGSAAFYGCEKCQFILAPNHDYFALINEGLYAKSEKKLIAFSWEKEKSNSNTSQADNRSVAIPEGILSIGDYVFADFTDTNWNTMPSFSLPSTLESIGNYAFASFKKKPKIYITDRDAIESIDGDLVNLKTIGEGAFWDTCVVNANLCMPNVQTIGDFAFHGSYMLGKDGFAIDFKDAQIQKIGEGAFTQYSIGFGLTPQNYSYIGKNNPGLGKYIKTENDFSPYLQTIPSGLNPQVTSLPNTITSIESFAFTDSVSDFRLSCTLNAIAVDAFPKGSTFIVDAGSYAELWCSENGFGYSIEGQQDDLSWLTN